ncbi:MAG TPA: sigma 54-interacting transcriptional regulator [Thermodesulfobacteriota bacterium]|nr:sigma 54-interacting transcriptional regulator [Thermodesulfobacteriota bacterium]
MGRGENNKKVKVEEKLQEECRKSEPKVRGRTAELEKISKELRRELSERRQAEKSLHKSEKRLQKWNKVLVKLASSRVLERYGLDSALREITESAARTLEVERVNIWLYNEGRTKIECVEHYGLTTGRHSKGFELAAADYPSYFKALEEERIIAAHDAHTDPRTREFSESYLTPLGISSLLDAPIRVRGRMVGVIGHENVGPSRHWTREEQSFAGSMADFVSLALEAWEQKRTEEELERSISLLQATLESTADGILVVDTEGKIISSNRKFIDMWRIPDSIMKLGDDKKAVSFVLDQLKDPETFLNKVRVLYNQPNSESYDVLEFKDGRIFERYSQPQRIGEKIIGRVWSFRDVTERKLAEDALKDSLAQLSKKNRYETIISAVTRSVHKSINLQEVLENAVDAMSNNIDRAQNVAIFLVEGDEAVMKAYRGFPDWFVNRLKRIPYPKGVTWRTIIEGKHIYSGDAERDNVIGPAGKELGTKSYLSMPIQSEGNTVGVININSFQYNAFDEEVLNLLEIVSQQIQVAINNARQAEALRKSEETLRETLVQLSKRNRYETIISCVTRSVHQSTDLPEVMDNAVEAICENIDGADSASIYLVEGEEAVLKAHRGYSDWYVDRVGRVPYPRGYVWKVIMDEKPRYCADVDEDAVIGPAGREFGIKSYLSMPIQFEGKTIGVININSFEKNAFDEGELKLLEMVREQITVALGNARQKGDLQEALSEVEMLKNRLQSDNLYFEGEIKVDSNFKAIVGRSSSLRKVLFKAEQAASSNANVPILILGEPGTGKELLARTIHSVSARKDKPFVKITLSLLSEEQIETELFGREERGALSGALSLTVGRFEAANGGTIFLNDIADLSLGTQARLLRIIQEGEFRRLDGYRNVKVDIRLIAATTHDLVESVESGSFQEDLYHELSVFQINIPPLRERKEDLPLLVKHFIMKHGSRLGKKIETVPQKGLDILHSYNWPGNVQELENIIERAVILTNGSTLELDERLNAL